MGLIDFKFRPQRSPAPPYGSEDPPNVPSNAPPPQLRRLRMGANGMHGFPLSLAPPVPVCTLSRWGEARDRGQLTFYKNGQPVPLLKRRPDVPLPEAYALLPAVCLYAARPRPAPSPGPSPQAAPNGEVFGGRIARVWISCAREPPTLPK